MLCVLTAVPALTTVIAADVQEDIGLDALRDRLGTDTPTGVDVVISQVEVLETAGYVPDENNEHLVGKTFHPLSGESGVSAHATNVCQWMCGVLSSPAPDVEDIYCWETVDWCTNGFLRANFPSSTPPYATPSLIKIFNLSWIASFGVVNNNHQVLRRADYVVERDDVLMCYGIGSAGQGDIPLMTCMFNGLAVGKANGEHLLSDTSSTYEGGGRMRPEIVAPISTSSAAAGIISGGAALLTETARTDGSLPSAAETSEVLKAILLAGATHMHPTATWSNEAVQDGPDRGIATRPIDNTVGAGRLNVDLSHQILTGGRFWGGVEPSSPTESDLRAWDHAFCLSGYSRWWSFTIDGQVEEVTIAATWNRIVSDEYSTYAMGNVELELWALDSEGNQVSLVGDEGLGIFGSGNVASRSAVDNVEMLVIHDLAPGEYLLEMHHTPSGVASLIAGIAWTFSDPQTVDVPGDVNGDGLVGVADLLAVIADWNCIGECEADVNDDQIVNVQDLLLVISNWG